MSFSKVYSAQNTLLQGQKVDIEVDISRGLHSFKIVGLGDKAIEEAISRVSSAIKNTGFKSPKQKNEKVVVSLAPAHIKKHGPLFDLGIALSYLKASKDVDFESNKTFFFGELSLDGKLRPVKGILPLVRFAKESGIKEIFIPKENAEEAAIISGIDIYGAETLGEVLAHLNTLTTKSPNKTSSTSPTNSKKDASQDPKGKIKKQQKTSLKNIKELKKSLKIDLSDIKDQDSAKRGLEIAAAGKHNIALYGPPGTGKTMLAKAFSGILPKLSFEEMLDVTSIHSAAGTLKEPLMTDSPFRSPHHTSSYVSIFGGGVNIKPGEITLAHKGILFLDEFPEFEKRVIEGLRQPLEDGEISISRASGSVQYPSQFILITTMNPCPCGYKNSASHDCTCSVMQVDRYKQKISGPIIDRVDLWIEVGEVTHEKLIETDKKNTNEDKGEEEEVSESALTKSRVEKCRNIQIKRQGKPNSELSPKEISKYIKLGPNIKTLLTRSAKKLKLSARGFHKMIKLSRTIADLDNQKEIKEEHLLEALQYRSKQV